MNKRQEIRARRQRARMRSRIGIIALVSVGALLVAAAFILSNRPPDADPLAAQITPIATKQLTVSVDGTSLGDINAPVRIDVWEDFQCPACKNYSEQIETQVIENLVETGLVYYTFHFFAFIDGRVPGGESQQSSNAAMCALEQGRFWDFHDLLYMNWNGENRGGFAAERLLAFARHLELDMTAFESCFEESRYQADIDRDYEAGLEAGVHGTPSVFVNGNLLTPGYVPTYEHILEAVEAILARQ